MQKIILSLFLIAFVSGIDAYSDVRFFKSNQVGMRLSPIKLSERNNFDYILEVSITKNMESRKLVEKGKVIKRWEIAIARGGKPESETVYEDEKLASKTIYDSNSRIKEEAHYREDVLVSKAAYTYLGQNKFVKETTGTDGEILYSEEHKLSDSGEVREIKKTWPDGLLEVTSYIHSRKRLFGLLQRVNEEMTIARYDNAGNLQSVEVWKDQTLTRKNVNEYSPGGGNISQSETEDREKNTLVKQTFDTDGRIVKEITEQTKTVIEEKRFFYNEDGRRIRMTRTSQGGLEEWLSSYGEDGELSQEDYKKRGRLEKRTIYEEPGTFKEEIYDRDSLAVIAYYEKQKKIKEEYFENGKLAREREIK